MRNFLLSLVLGTAPVLAFASAVDDARALYDEGRYPEALEKLEAAVARSPRDGNANYWLGATLLKLNRTADAIAPLTKAESRGVADAA
ncbi:MAG: tetratricopeptide repeat protein, partial [Muribaculaceae bacterium]|nr:tetratricopeptide repeat protein [Muribaculaceae bacterium]